MKANNIAIVRFSIAVLILGLMGFWLFKSTKPFDEYAYSIIGIILIIVGFVIYSGIQALKDATYGLSPIDELSKAITEKAAATAFRMSIYMWLFGLFAIDLFPIVTVREAKFVIAMGMMGMGLIYLISRLYFSRVGIDENKN